MVVDVEVSGVGVGVSDCGKVEHDTRGVNLVRVVLDGLETTLEFLEIGMGGRDWVPVFESQDSRIGRKLMNDRLADARGTAGDEDGLHPRNFSASAASAAGTGKGSW